MKIQHLFEAVHHSPLYPRFIEKISKSVQYYISSTVIPKLTKELTDQYEDFKINGNDSTDLFISDPITGLKVFSDELINYFTKYMHGALNELVNEVEVSKNNIYVNLVTLKVNGRVQKVSESRYLLELNSDLIRQLNSAITAAWQRNFNDSPASELLKIRRDPLSNYRIIATALRSSIDPFNIVDSQQVIDEMHSVATTLIHELVHVSQMDPQVIKPQYYSYLSDPKKRDKTTGKDELLQLAAKQDRTPTENARYERLYAASPQEIAAIAHNISTTVLRKLNLYDLDVAKNLYAQGALEGTIMSNKVRRNIDLILTKHLSKVLGSISSNDEVKVLNRYRKLIYQELHAFIDSVKTHTDKDTAFNTAGEVKPYMSVIDV